MYWALTGWTNLAYLSGSPTQSNESKCLPQLLIWQKELKLEVHSKEVARKIHPKVLHKLRQHRNRIPDRLTRKGFSYVFLNSLGQCTKMKSNHQTPMETTIIANIDIEKDIRSILSFTIRKMSVSTDEIGHQLAKYSVIWKTMNCIQRKLPSPPIKGRICYSFLSDVYGDTCNRTILQTFSL